MTWTACWEEMDGSAGGGIAVDRLFDDGEIFFWRRQRGTTESPLLSPLPTEVTASLEVITSGVKTSLKTGLEHSSPKKTSLKKLFLS